VGVGVEVNRVGQILTTDWIPRGFIHILRPSLGAQDDDVAAVLPNHRDELLVVWLDGSRPAHLERLIVGLIQHIGVTSILACHLREEPLCLIRVLLCMVVMPIYHHIDAHCDCSVNDSLHPAFFSPRILQVASMLDTHGAPDHSDFPVVHQPLYGSTVPILRHPLRPKQRHTLQFDW